MANRVSDVDARHLKGLETILYKPLLYSFLLSNDPAVQHISENILALPAAMFLS
jgi:hypothetical protein